MTNGISTNGVTAFLVCLFVDRGTLWVLLLTYLYLPKSARAYLFPHSVKIYYRCSGPISVAPICPRPMLICHGMLFEVPNRPLSYTTVGGGVADISQNVLNCYYASLRTSPSFPDYFDRIARIIAEERYYMIEGFYIIFILCYIVDYHCRLYDSILYDSILYYISLFQRAGEGGGCHS